MENQTQLSQEEITKRREELKEYYNSMVPFLTLQYEYESLITKIEQTKTDRIIAQIQRAQILSPESPENTDEEELSDKEVIPAKKESKLSVV